MWRTAVLFIVLATTTQNTEQFPSNAEILSQYNMTRIVGGNPTTIEKYPYLVQVLNGVALSCGGTLVSKRHVLSAAHCFVTNDGQTSSPRLFRARVGTTYLTGGTVYSVSELVVHQQYVPPHNDIAIMVLTTDVWLTARVAIASIAGIGSVVKVDSPVTAVGWGRTHPTSAISQVLNEVQVYVVDQEICKTNYHNLGQLLNASFPVSSDMVCAGLITEGGKDACQGDSGGPLLYGDTVVGITSWGYSCALPHLPGVYARVSSYTNWINSTVLSRVNGASSLQINIVSFISTFIILIW